MSKTTCLLSAATAIAIITACQSRGNESGAGQTTATATTGSRSDTSGKMAGMPGMSGGMMMDTGMTTMMDSMRAELTRMDAMTPAQMTSMMETHRQMAGNILAQMNNEMRSMNMTADPAWTALVDFIRQDLVRMPDVSGARLNALMRAHRVRMDRLMTMHRDMVSKMSPPKK